MSAQPPLGRSFQSVALAMSRLPQDWHATCVSDVSFEAGHGMLLALYTSALGGNCVAAPRRKDSPVTGVGGIFNVALLITTGHGNVMLDSSSSCVKCSIL